MSKPTKSLAVCYEGVTAKDSQEAVEFMAEDFPLGATYRVCGILAIRREDGLFRVRAKLELEPDDESNQGG